METVIINVVKSQLKAYPPETAIDVIRTAKMLITEMEVDVSIVKVLEVIAQDETDPVMKKIKTLLKDDLVQDIAKSLHVKPPPRGCLCFGK